jgi:hypothetical protein
MVEIHDRVIIAARVMIHGYPGKRWKEEYSREKMYIDVASAILCDTSKHDIILLLDHVKIYGLAFSLF